jgi:hypothetical protein
MAIAGIALAASITSSAVKKREYDLRNVIELPAVWESHHRLKVAIPLIASALAGTVIAKE